MIFKSVRLPFQFRKLACRIKCFFSVFRFSCPSSSLFALEHVLTKNEKIKMFSAKNLKSWQLKTFLFITKFNILPCKKWFDPITKLDFKSPLQFLHVMYTKKFSIVTCPNLIRRSKNQSGDGPDSFSLITFICSIQGNLDHFFPFGLLFFS